MTESTPRSTAEVAYGKAPDKPQDEEPSKDAGAPPASPADESRAPLLPPDRTSGFSSRWTDVQARFVDEPRDAVTQADALVAEVIQELATRFADQRQGLEDQWGRGTDVSTEDLRQALMQYRSFFQRLLSA